MNLNNNVQVCGINIKKHSLRIILIGSHKNEILSQTPVLCTQWLFHPTGLVGSDESDSQLSFILSLSLHFFSNSSCRIWVICSASQNGTIYVYHMGTATVYLYILFINKKGFNNCIRHHFLYITINHKIFRTCYGIL